MWNRELKAVSPIEARKNMDKLRKGHVKRAVEIINTDLRAGIWSIGDTAFCGPNIHKDPEVEKKVLDIFRAAGWQVKIDDDEDIVFRPRYIFKEQGHGTTC